MNYLCANIDRKTDSEIAKHLHRPKSSVNAKRYSMGIKGGLAGNTDMLRASDVARLTGCDVTSITRDWKTKGLITERHGKDVFVKISSLNSFMKNHIELWDWKKCDKTFFASKSWFTDVMKTGNNRHRHQRWNEFEEARLKALLSKGKTHREIGEILGRSKSSVSRHIDETRSKSKDFARMSLEA